MSVSVAVFFIVVGLLLVVRGYQLLRLIMGITGFLCGVLLSYPFVLEMSKLGGILTSIISGTLGALLLYFLYGVSIFAVGALTAILISFLFLQPSVLWGSIIGGIGGILALVLEKYVLALITSLLGAYSTCLGIVILKNSEDLLSGEFLKSLFGVLVLPSEPIYLATLAVLTLLGVWIQIRHKGNRTQTD